MEFFDEDARPRFFLQSNPKTPQSTIEPRIQFLHKLSFLISISLAAIFLILSFLYFTSDFLKFIFIWLSLSFLVGPFAPLSLTAGDIRVGIGSPTEQQQQQPSDEELEKFDDNSRRFGRKSSKSNRKLDDPISVIQPRNGSSGQDVLGTDRTGISSNGDRVERNGTHVEGDWIEGEEELLKKLMGKHPVGKPGRWEAIAEGFNGRHSTESVINRAKEMGERKVNDDDSYNRFLRDRKTVQDKRIDDGGSGGNEVNNGTNQIMKEGNGWSSAEDLSLLNALKAFPKDTAMRWEKVAAAVPGRSKAACLRRMNELKKDFRSSKAAAT